MSPPVFELITTDPVCGMTVKPDSPRRFDYQDRTYLFCSDGCLAKFRADPEKYLKNPPKPGSHAGMHHVQPLQLTRGRALPPGSGQASSAATAVHAPAPEAVPPSAGRAATGAGKWTCPMHPEILRDGPGSCPLCGMALEPVIVTSDGDEENPELRDMTRRLWISAVLSIPVLVISMAGIFQPAAKAALIEGRGHFVVLLVGRAGLLGERTFFQVGDIRVPVVARRFFTDAFGQQSANAETDHRIGQEIFFEEGVDHDSSE